MDKSQSVVRKMETIRTVVRKDGREFRVDGSAIPGLRRFARPSRPTIVSRKRSDPAPRWLWTESPSSIFGADLRTRPARNRGSATRSYA